MTVMSNRTMYTTGQFIVKDKWSAITHFIGFVAAIIGMPVLLIKASYEQASLLSMVALAVFMLCMIVLYGASTAYHSFHLDPKAEMVLKKIDHLSIFLLIAGSYTPVCLIALKDTDGIRLLILVWSVALIGMIFKYFFVTCPKWVSSVIYSVMGWLCITSVTDIIHSIGTAGFSLLLAGGLFYTVGSVIYAIKPRFLAGKEFGNHEIFHCFVLEGSLCHFLVMYLYVI